MISTSRWWKSQWKYVWGLNGCLNPGCVVVSRQGVSVPQEEDVAPVSDLLGSILSGQSMLLMDSSDVVINRDGSLKATKPGKSCFGDIGCFTGSLVQNGTLFALKIGNVKAVMRTRERTRVPNLRRPVGGGLSSDALELWCDFAWNTSTKYLLQSHSLSKNSLVS